MTASFSYSRRLAALFLGIVLLAGWFVYQPAVDGMLLLDDASNLGALQDVDDYPSALRFVLSGTAGPTGRPIALASFLPQASEWEAGAASFLTVNILIHLANGCLLGWFLYRLTLLRRVPVEDARFVALVAMALWLFMPLLASSTLMVVQRMTTLSASFVLLGLNGYLWFRGRLERGAFAGLSGMSVTLVSASILATLTKESGALLPVLVLVTEMTVLTKPRHVSESKWFAWLAIFLALPTVLLAAFLATRLPYAEELVLRRDFNGTERLLTESGVLWQYLFNAFVPLPGRYGPFHDGYTVARSLFEPLTFLAVAGWIAATVVAVIWRRRYPLFSFAILWFLAGHLLESTTLALELYFEHRNYIPVMGPVYALTCSALLLSGRYKKALRVGIGLYLLLNALFLYSQTTLWGEPRFATRYWHERFPESSRAASTMATNQLSKEGPEAALATISHFVTRHPEHGYLGIPALSLSCIIAPDGDHRRSLRAVENLLPNVRFSYSAGTMLSDLLTTVDTTNCRGLDRGMVERLANILAVNPRYASAPEYQVLHHQLMARIAREAGDTNKTLDHLQKAMSYKGSARLNMMMVTTLVSVGRFDDARSFVGEARQNLPLNPMKRYLWQLDLDEWARYIRQLEDAS